ncbi:hypothetical protein BDW02DRAFT_423475 [Decorospora gaudefroyi]|uniref:Uncharacterized protein n=1 Tax=Decorospora gaudefroyi TaxID=184978 RepID=A0A6A5K5M5_9PLEO|nr:hypothetical protein BDW02DRAFT_423475 [Decorospora gaudefroyi]
MNPPAPNTSAKDPTPTPAPATPGGRERTLSPSTPRPPSTPIPAPTPRTPGGTSATACTVDEAQYSKVTVHTAKCTECDKRNTDTMRRCPGCTFQVCRPCYERRERLGKGLLHGNMSTSSVLAAGSGGRTVRKRPIAGTPVGRASEEMVDESKNGDGEAGKMTEKEKATPIPKSTAKKRAINMKASAVDGEPDVSSEDDFEPDDISPTPSKRPRTDLTFAESALATAARTPPTTRATRRKSLPAGPAASNRDLSPARSDPINPRSSKETRPGGLAPMDLLYQAAVEGYDEPLLGRRQPVMSNPVAEIPTFPPRRSVAEMQKLIQEKTLRKVQEKHLAKVQEEALNNDDAQWAMAEKEARPLTVRAFVETEAAKYQDDVGMDEDDNKALFNAMEGAALVWGKKTYNMLDAATQRMMQPGLNMRLDCIGDSYKSELSQLMTERATRVLRDLAGDDGSSAAPADTPR